MNYCYSNDLWLGFDTIIRHFNVDIIKRRIYIVKGRMEFIRNIRKKEYRI